MKNGVLNVFFLLSSFLMYGQSLDNTVKADEHFLYGSSVESSIKLDKNSHDFGDMKQGEAKQQIFKITNIGTDPLIISDVHTQCGCTAVNYPSVPVLPGETKELVVEFNSAGKMGIQRKTVTILSNKGETKIRILANVF